MIINVHASVDSHSVPYFEYMISNYEKLATEHDIVFYAHCLDQQSAQKVSSRVKQALFVGNGRSSIGHGMTIKSALNAARVTPGEIDIIADVDTVMLMKGWDVVTADELSRVGVFGSTFEKIGGYCSGPGPVQMYKNKPTFTWFAMSKRHDFSSMDTTPIKGQHLPITSAELSELYQMPIGFSVLRDTGWQIPEFLARHQIPYSILLHEKPTDKALALKTGNNYHEEYQYNGAPFVAHQRGSLNHPFRGNEISRTFYDTIDAYLSTRV